MKTKDFLNQSWVKQNLVERFCYDEILGILSWKPRKTLSKEKWHQPVGYINVDKEGYKCLRVSVDIRGKKLGLTVARIIWLLKVGNWPNNTMDHINKNSLDNSWKNLRDVTQSENNQNKSSYKKSLGFCGVSKHHGKFWSRFVNGGVTYSLGHYDTQEEAARAYDRKAFGVLGSKANLNFPLDESPRTCQTEYNETKGKPDD